jgi:hypothetical protein
MSGRDRNVNQVTVSGDYTVPLDMDYIFCDELAADIVVTLKRTKDRLIRWHKVEKSDDSEFTVTVTDGTLSYVLSAQGQAATFEIDANGNFHVFAASALGVSGGLAIPAGGSITYSPTAFSDADSFQPIGPDLNLAAGAGVDDPDTAYLAPIMGNVIGDALTEDANTIAGLIGKLSVSGARATTYPLAAVVGEVGEDSENADGSFVAAIGGDSGAVNANAAFGIDHLNSTAGSGFDWIVDGHKEAHNGYNAGVPLKGFARLSVDAGGLPVGLYFGPATDDVGIVAQVGADNTIADGSLYVSAVVGAGKLFQKQNDVWVDLQA